MAGTELFVRLPPLRIADQQAHTSLLKLREDVRLVNQVRPRLAFDCACTSC